MMFSRYDGKKENREASCFPGCHQRSVLDLPNFKEPAVSPDQAVNLVVPANLYLSERPTTSTRMSAMKTSGISIMVMMVMATNPLPASKALKYFTIQMIRRIQLMIGMSSRKIDQPLLSISCRRTTIWTNGIKATQGFFVLAFFALK